MPASDGAHELHPRVEDIANAPGELAGFIQSLNRFWERNTLAHRFQRGLRPRHKSVIPSTLSSEGNRPGLRNPRIERQREHGGEIPLKPLSAPGEEKIGATA